MPSLSCTLHRGHILIKQFWRTATKLSTDSMPKCALISIYMSFDIAPNILYTMLFIVNCNECLSAEFIWQTSVPYKRIGKHFDLIMTPTSWKAELKCSSVSAVHFQLVFRLLITDFYRLCSQALDTLAIQCMTYPFTADNVKYNTQLFIYFTSAAVTVDSSHMTASSSTS